MRDSADLREYLEAIDLCYFDGALEELGVKVKWDRSRSKQPARVGFYWEDTRVIEIARVLADESIPRFYVLYVIFHEALHAVYGKEHTKIFKQAEKQFAYTFEVGEWECKNTDQAWPDPPKGLR